MFVEFASLAAMMAAVSAHNWVNAPSRVSLDKNAASLVAPVVPSPTDEPHAVVTAGQKFQFEWVTGHNLDTYVILLAKKDAAQMKNHELPMMENFLKDPACPQNPPPAQWLNYHYKYNDTSLSFFGSKDSNGVLPAPIPNFYKRRTLATEAHFIPRSPAFKKTMKNMRAPAGPKVADVFQFEYKDADVATNRRCVPADPINKWPWVIAMHKFRHVRHQPTEADVAWLQFPAGTPPGDYIVHYRWRSYYDAMDVRVVAGTTPVANPFGGGSTTPTGAPVPRFKRIDHCVFYNSTLAAGGTCVKMSVAGGKLAVPDACLNACKAMTIDKCDGVAVVPLVNDPAVAPLFQNQINIPFRATSCVKPTDASTHMCFPVLQAEVTQTQNSFVVTTDVEDPAFYSTCFRRSDAIKRDGLPDPNTLPYIAADVPDWKANSRCISCADQDKFSKADVTPVWELATSCINCNLAK